MPESFDPYVEWLEIRDPQRPVDHYVLLGLNRFESDPPTISHAADVRMAKLRKIRPGSHLPDWGRLLDQLSAAKVCLLDASSKAAYDAGLQSQAPQQPDTASRPAPDVAYPSTLATPPTLAQPMQGPPAESAGASPAQPAGGMPWSPPADTAPPQPQSPASPYSPPPTSPYGQPQQPEQPQQPTGFFGAQPAVPGRAFEAPPEEAVTPQEPTQPTTGPSYQAPQYQQPLYGSPQSPQAPTPQYPAQPNVPADGMQQQATDFSGMGAAQPADPFAPPTGGPAYPQQPTTAAGQTWAAAPTPMDMASMASADPAAGMGGQQVPMGTPVAGEVTADPNLGDPRQTASMPAGATIATTEAAPRRNNGSLVVTVLLLVVAAALGGYYFSRPPAGDATAEAPAEPPKDQPGAEPPETPQSPVPQSPPASPGTAPQQPGTEEPPARPPAEPQPPTPPEPAETPQEPATTPATEPPAEPEPPAAEQVDPQKQAALAAALNAVRAAMADRDLETARQQLQVASTNAQTDEDQQQVVRLETMANYLDSFWSGLGECVASLDATQELELQNTRIVVVDSSQRQLIVRAAGRNRSWAIRDIPTSVIMAITRECFADDPGTKAILGTFLAVDPKGDRARARQLWQEASRSGIDVDLMMPELDIAPVEGGGATTSGTAKVAVPSDAARLQQAEQSVREVFARAYAAATTDARRQELAEELLARAPTAGDDPAVRFVMLREARDLAVAAGDVATAGKAVDEMAHYYNVDLVEATAAAMEAVGRNARGLNSHKEIAQRLLTTLPHAVKAKRTAEARRLADLALEAARKAKSPSLMQQATAIKQQLQAAGNANRPGP